MLLAPAAWHAVAHEGTRPDADGVAAPEMMVHASGARIHGSEDDVDRLARALDLLIELGAANSSPPVFREILDSFRTKGVDIEFDSDSCSKGAFYSMGNDRIVIGRGNAEKAIPVLAGYIAHEGVHATQLPPPGFERTLIGGGLLLLQALGKLDRVGDDWEVDMTVRGSMAWERIKAVFRGKDPVLDALLGSYRAAFPPDGWPPQRDWRERILKDYFAVRDELVRRQNECRAVRDRP